MSNEVTTADEPKAKSQNPNVRRVAAIDMGSNSTKMYIAALKPDGQIEKVYRDFRSTRLGAGLDVDGYLTDKAIARAVKAMTDFRQATDEYDVDRIIAVATQFAREARNGAALQEAVFEATGINLQIISGDEEARLAFVAAASDFTDSEERILVFNTGGGSTELIYGLGADAQAMVSVPLGAVYLTRMFPELVGVNEEAGLAAAFSYVGDNLRAGVSFLGDAKGARVVGSGGGMRSLAAILGGGISENEISAINLFAMRDSVVRETTMWLASMTVDERRQVPGLEPDRADIIVAGGIIAISIIEAVAADGLTFSARNLRDGLLFGELAAWRTR